MTQVTIYTKSWCPYCLSAKQLLSAKNAEFTEIDVERTPGAIEEMIEKSGGRKTVPQIFIGGKHIGGNDDLHALDREGKLDSLLQG